MSEHGTQINVHAFYPNCLQFEVNHTILFSDDFEASHTGMFMYFVLHRQQICTQH